MSDCSYSWHSPSHSKNCYACKLTDESANESPELNDDFLSAQEHEQAKCVVAAAFFVRLFLPSTLLVTIE